MWQSVDSVCKNMPLVSVNQDDKLNVYFPSLPHHYVYKLQYKLTFVKADKVKALSHYVLCSLSQKYIMRFISLSYDLFCITFIWIKPCLHSLIIALF